MAAFRFLLIVVGGLVPFVASGQSVPAPDTGATRSARPDTLPDRPAGTDSLMRVALPELRVVERAASSRLSTPTAVTTVDLRSPTAHSGQSVADLLAARTNLFVKQYGAGGLATASMRGLGSSQTLVLVDGQRVADPQTGQADLSLLPSLLVESAQVRHGSQGARYGSGTLGGVVQLQTRRPSAPLRVETTAGMGAYGWQTAGGVVSGEEDRWSGILAAEGTRSDGNFPYQNTSLVPAQTRRRTNAGRRHATVFARGTHQGPVAQSSATVWWTEVDRDLPGTANASTSDATQHDTQWRLSGRYRRPLPTGRLQLAVRGQRASRRFLNPDPDPRFTQADTTRTYRATAEATAHASPGPQLLLTAGLTGGYDRAAVQDGVHRWRMGAFADATWSLGALTLHPALRLDADRPSGAGRNLTVLSPQMGAVWQPGPSWLRLKGQVGRAFRAPTFNERFYEPGGNPSLRAESGWSGEAGVAIQIGTRERSLGAEGTVFATRLHDQIVWQPSYVGPGLQVWRPSNVAQVLTRGVEWTSTGQWRFGPQMVLDGRLAFTHVAATDRSMPQARPYGKQLPYTPRQRLKVRAGWSWHSVRLDLSTRLVGSRYVTADETQALSPYQVVDVGLQFRRTVGPASVTAHLDVKNLFDEDYSVVRLYPMPPRHLRARLTIAFP
jgi:vitamin B12 transporter